MNPQEVILKHFKEFCQYDNSKPFGDSSKAFVIDLTASKKVLHTFIVNRED